MKTKNLKAVSMAEVSEAIKWAWTDARNGHFMCDGPDSKLPCAVFADVKLTTGKLGYLHVCKRGGVNLRWHNSAFASMARDIDEDMRKMDCASDIPRDVASPREVVDALTAELAKGKAGARA